MSVRISVIIPVYNVKKWLRECLDSVCGQTLREIEILCVNDGSTDGSPEILREYAARDERIVIIDKENAGVGAARNDGIRAAKGEYVAFMDPDDKYPDPEVLELLCQAATDHHVKVAGGYLGSMDENSRPIPKSRSYFGVDFTCEGLVSYRDFQCDFQFTAYVYDRAFLLRNDLFFPTYSRFQDPPFFVNTMLCAKTFFAVNRMTYVYRVGAGKPKLTERKAFDLLRGLSDNLRRSGEEGLGRLHYLSAMRLLTDASYLVESMAENKAFPGLVWSYIQAAGLIDEALIAGAGYALPEPVLPGLFVHLIEDRRQYRTLMKHKSVRVLNKLFARS